MGFMKQVSFIYIIYAIHSVKPSLGREEFFDQCRDGCARGADDPVVKSRGDIGGFEVALKREGAGGAGVLDKTRGRVDMARCADGDEKIGVCKAFENAFHLI